MVIILIWLFFPMDLIISVKLIRVFLLINKNSTLLLWRGLNNYNFFRFWWSFLRGIYCCNYLNKRMQFLLFCFWYWFSYAGKRFWLYFSWRISILESILSRNILFSIILSRISLLVILFFIWELHADLLLLVGQAVSGYRRFLVWSNRTCNIS